MEQDTASDYENPLAKALFAVACAVAYFFAFKLNLMLFDSLEFSQGVNWIFLPSGLRMLLVLVLLHSGAVGIALASCFINYMTGSPDQHMFNIVTAIISGFAPLIARQICVDYLQLGTSLNNLTSKSLFQLSVVFAVISGVLHQVWFFWNHATENFVVSSFVMSVGDWVGTVLVLATASVLIKLHSTLTSQK
jgi:hypothetical protein